jgi:ABC transporter DrrB family efflux protein
MTTATFPHAPARPGRWQALRWAVTDSLVLTWRSLARIVREPETLMDVTVQPVMFVLLFAFVFGGAIGLPGGGSYHEYLIGGMFGMGVAGSAPGTAVALAADMSEGIVDRFRSLPMSRAAVLIGRTTSDLLTQMIGASVVAVTGLAIGWRIHNGLGDALVGLGLALLFGYAFSWAGVCLGMKLRSVEAAQQLAFILFIPLTFISNAFVPTQGMPGWLQVVADWNPFSAVAAACRQLFGNPNPSALVHAWPMQHPELAVLGWSALFLAVFAPLAVHLYARKTR